MRSSAEAARPSHVAAKLFRGLADPTRLRILLVLLEGERRVSELVAEIGCSQANVSGHLACLKDCGLVQDRPDGRQVFYRVASDDVFELLQAAEGVLERTGPKIELCPNYVAAP